MESIFKIILMTSMYASVVGIVILILKKGLKNRISPKWHYFIWFILIFKLIMPFGPKSVISLFNAVPKVPQNVNFSQSYKQYHKTITSIKQKKSNVSTIYIVKDKSLHLAVITEIAIPYIWFLGVILMSTWLIFSNYLLHKKLKKNKIAGSAKINNIFEESKKKANINRSIEILIQNAITTPAIFGVIKPKVLIPPEILSMDDKQISYIFLHELAHYKRRDLIANYILLILQTIHWFNPIIWYCFKIIRQDMETAADEMVLLILDSKEQKEYGKALLDVLEKFNSLRFAPKLIGMIDDKKNMERRIRMIKMNNFFRNRKRIVIITGILCISVFSAGLLTNAVTDKTPELKVGAYTSNLFKFNMAYTGDKDNSKVINLINNLPYGKNQNGVLIKSNNAQYDKNNHKDTNDMKNIKYGTYPSFTATIKYDFSHSKTDIEKIRTALKNNAALMFVLVGCVDDINYDLITKEKTLTYRYTREQIQENFPKDLRSYSRHEKAFPVFLRSFAMTFSAWPEKYSLVMSSTPGIRISVKYNGTADKVKYSTKYGQLETWDQGGTWKVKSYGKEVVLPINTPVYWCCLEKGKETKNKKTYINAEIMNENTVMAEKRMDIISNGEIGYTVDTASDVVIVPSKSVTSLVTNPEKTIQDIKSIGRAHNKELQDELPKIKITVGDKQISYASAKNKWNGNTYTYEDTFKTILKNISEAQIPYIKLGETAEISFENNPPSKLEISDIIIDNTGRQIYDDRATTKTIIKPNGDKFYYNIALNMASYLSNVIKKTDIRGIRMIASWGKNKCEYAFVIRTDAA